MKLLAILKSQDSSIPNGLVSSKIYNKQEDFDFEIHVVNSDFMRCSLLSVENPSLTAKLPKQGY